MAKSTTSQFIPVRNSAVQLCREAYLRAMEESKARGLDYYDTDDEACRAFREAMPHLSTAAGIRDFIACVTYGLMTDVFIAMEASKLLYAAQVATGALRNESKVQNAG